MLALLLESALRSLLLGAAVWLGLKFLRVKNPHAHMTAWTLVLVASLAMPALMRLVTVTIPDAPPAPLAQIIWPAPTATPLSEPAQAIPADLIHAVSLCGPADLVRDRLAAFRDAGVGTLMVSPMAWSAEDRVAQLRAVAELAA